MRKQPLQWHRPRWTWALCVPLLLFAMLTSAGVSHAVSLNSNYGRIAQPGVWFVQDILKPRESLIRKLPKGTHVHILGRHHPWLEVEVLRGKNARGYVGHRYVSPLSALATQRLLQRQLANQQKEEETKRREAVLEEIQRMAIEYRRSEVPKVWLVERPSNPTDTIIRKLPLGTLLRVLHSSQGWSRVVVVDDEPTAGWILDSLTAPLEDNEAIDAHVTFSRSLEPGHSTVATGLLDSHTEPINTLSNVPNDPSLASTTDGKQPLHGSLKESAQMAANSGSSPRLDATPSSPAAQNPRPRTEAPAPTMSGQGDIEPAFEMDYTPLLAVICVLCFLFVGSRFMPKISRRTLVCSGNDLVELKSVTLGKNEKLTLVEAAGRLLVMATSSNGVQVLTELPPRKHKRLS